MKKIIFSIAVMVSAFFAASCQQENLEPVGGNTVTYTVQVPGAIATKSADGFVLTYEVYRAGEVGQVDEPAARPIYEGTKEFQNDKAELSLEFVKDQDFVVLFWAQKEGAPYNIGDLRKVSLTALTANDVNAEVFSGIDNVNNCKSVKGGVVELVRPIAQLNVATLTSGLTVGTVNNYSTVEPSTFNMSVNGLWSSYNVATGDVNGTADEFSYTDYDVVGGVFKTDYTLLGKNYIGFIPKDGTNVTVDFNILTAKDGTINHVVSNVPVRPNYRTNILGNLVSASDNYTITLDEEWGDAGKDMEVLADGLVKNINGDYEITSEVGLAYAINNLFVDDEGVANSAAFYIEPDIYDMSQQAINDVVVKSGTLKVYDTEAVVTRSATFGSVVITGLNKPLITTVEEDATVFFSGITIQNYEGADGSAALVGNNEGKVVLTDCGIVDENGDQDNETPLVEGKDPVVVPKVEEPEDGLIYTAAQLAAAFAADTVETIVLGADIALEETLVFPEDREAVLDLRGWTITIADPEKVATTYALNNHGTLTIKDSYQIGSVNARGIYNGYVAEGDPITEAKLTIESGSFNAMGTNGGAAIFNYGIADIKGGSFTSIGGYSLNNQQGSQMTIADGVTANNGVYSSNAKLTINGGNISGNRSGCHVVYCWNTEVTINGGKFYNNNSGNSTVMAAGTTTIVYNGGTFGIKDGRVEGNGNTWTSCLLDSQNTATSEITGGTFNGGFRVQAGTSMTISGGSFNDCFGSKYNIYGSVSITGGTYTDDTAKAFATNNLHEDYKLVGETVVPKDYVAKIGDAKYETLQEAVTAVQDGETITLVADEVFTATNYFDNGGWKDGLGYSGDKSFTIDLDEHTISQDGALNDYLVWIKNVGSNENTITFKNGTMDAGKTAYCALCTASSHENKLTVNLENITLINENSNGSTVKIRAGSELNVKAGTKIIGKNSYLGIENWNAFVNIYDGAEIYMNGTSSYNGCLVGVGGNGTVNVYGGYGKGVSGGLIAMTSGGTINAMGGEWIANTDGTFANSNKSVLVAQSDKQYNAGAGNAVVNVTGGTYKGGYNCYGNAVGDAQINIKGGNFNANPANYVVAGYEVTENAGIYTVDMPAALKELEAALAKGGNVTLTNDVTLLESIKVENKVVLDLNGKTITAPLFSAFEVKAGGELTVKNGKVVAYESTVRAIGGKVIIESGEYTSTGTALDSPATYRYSLDCREGGELIINGGTFKSNNGMINVSSTVTINGGKFENIVEKSMTRHFAYVSALLTINDGEFLGKANGSAGGCFFCGAAAGCDIQVKGGKFTSLWTSGSVNRIFESYYGGSITVTGGMFNTNGGIATFVTENTDEATKAAYPYVAK